MRDLLPKRESCGCTFCQHEMHEYEKNKDRLRYHPWSTIGALAFRAVVSGLLAWFLLLLIASAGWIAAAQQIETRLAPYGL